MEEKAKLNESLIDQLLNDFINEELLSLYELKYTDFNYQYNQFDFYLKVTDLLRPSMCLVNDSYIFNKHTILRLNVNSIVYYSSLGKELFFAYLKEELNRSVTYTNYINRLSKGIDNVSICTTKS